MSKFKRWSIFLPLGLLAILMLTLLWLMHTQSGLQALISLANRSAKIDVSTENLVGTLPSFRASRIELTLQDGSLVLTDVATHWKPMSLLSGSLDVEAFDSKEVTIDWHLLPAKSKSIKPASSIQRPELPLALMLNRISIHALQFNSHHITNLNLTATFNDDIWSVSQATAETALGQLDISGQLTPTKQLPHSIDLVLTNPKLGNLNVTAKGEDANSTITIDATNLGIAAQASLSNLLGNLEWSAEATASDLSSLGIPGTARLNANGTLLAAQLSGQARVNDMVIAVEALNLTRKQDTIDASLSGQIDSWPVSATANLTANELLNGKLTVGHNAVDENLTLDQMTIELAGEWQALSGQLTAHGDLYGPASIQANVQANVDNNSDQQLVVDLLTAKLLDGSMTGSVIVQRSTTLTVDADIRANGINPALVNPVLPYSLNANATAQLSEGLLNLNVTDILAGIKGVQPPVLGTASLSINNQHLQGLHINLESDDNNTLEVVKPADSSIIRATVDFASIKSVSSELSGSAKGNISYDLNTQLPVGNLEIMDAKYGQYVRLERATFNGAETNGTQSLSFVGQNVELQNTKLDKVQAELIGSLSKHTINISTSMPANLTIDSELQGSLENAMWTGTIISMQVRHEQDRLTLLTPTRLMLSANHNTLGRACLTSIATSELCFEGSKIDQDITFSATVSIAPNESIISTLSQSFNGPEFSFPTGANANAHVDVRQGQLHAATIDSTIDTFTINPTNNTPLTLTNLALNAHAANETAEISFHVNPETGRINGQATVQGFQNPLLDGKIIVNLPDLSQFTQAISTPQLSGGEAAGTLTFSGTANNLVTTGSVDASNLEFSLPEIDTNYTGDVKMTINPSGSGHIEGQIMSKDGDLTVSGTLPLIGSGELNIAITGENFMLADSKDLSLAVHPDLAIKEDGNKIRLTGDVRVDQAFTTLQLPQFQSGITRTADIVFVDQEAQQEQSQRNASRSFLTDVNILLTSPIRIEGNGLLANVNGNMRVIGQENEELTAVGELSITGVYQAYGQSLDIERGTLTYTDSAVTNPYVDIYASRSIDTVTVGVRVSGKADDLVTRLESSPVIPESDILHYLVLGRAPGETTLSEQDLLAAEALNFALKRSAASLGNLGDELAGTELSLTQDVGQLALSIGKQVSSRLWVGYTVGLLEPIDIAMLRYQLSSKISLEAEVSDESRAAIKYRFDKD